MVATHKNVMRRSKCGRRLRQELVDLIRERLAGRLSRVEFETRVAEATLPDGVLSKSDFLPDAIDRIRQRHLDFDAPQVAAPRGARIPQTA